MLNGGRDTEIHTQKHVNYWLKYSSEIIISMPLEGNKSSLPISLYICPRMRASLFQQSVPLDGNCLEALEATQCIYTLLVEDISIWPNPVGIA